MTFTCRLCSQSFTDEWLRIAHWEIFHNTYGQLEQPRSSVIHYAPPLNVKDKMSIENDKEEVTASSPSALQNSNVQPTTSTQHHDASKNPIFAELIGEALHKSSVRHFRIRNTNEEDLPNFAEKGKKVIKKTLQEELNRINFIKFGLVLDAQFNNVENEIRPRAFICRNRSITGTSNLNEEIDECIQELILKVTEHESRGSGWSLLKTDSITIRVHKHGYGERGSSYLPLPNKIANTKSCINVQNEDNECFRYSMLAKHVYSKPERPSKHYNNVRHTYNFNGLTYPVSIQQIDIFEKNNINVSVNVYALECNNVYPLRVSSEERRDHTDLLLIKEGNISHYVYIKHFNALIVQQITKEKAKISAICKRCLNFTKNKKYNAKQWLKEHNLLCNRFTAAKIKLPSKEKSVVSFNNTNFQYPIPIVVYADFEASLLPTAPIDADITTRTKYQKHEPNSYCLLLKSPLEEEHLKQYGLSLKPQIYRGENAASKFVDTLYEIAKKVEDLYKQKVPMKELNIDQQQAFNAASNCCLCDIYFNEENYKVRDHDHLTGIYRGAACNLCNIQYRLPNYIPVILHNLSCYDAHFIVPQLGRDDGKIDVLATTSENYISFSKKVGKLKLRFIDSYRFIPSSLANLTKNLQRDSLIETRKLVEDDNLNLVLRKGVFCYDYIDSLEKFNETSLPSKEKFYNKLLNEHVTAEDYNHACNVWNTLNMTTLGAYSDLYVTLDVTLLCDIMEEFRKTCMSAYGIDPLHCYTSPGLAWQAMLKMTKCKLQLLTDIDMVLMVESAVRGGITQCVTRHVKANNNYMTDYDMTKESNYIGYFDANNLYGWAMSKPLPYDNFEWVNSTELPNIESIPVDGDTGYIMEVDFEYPDNFHDLHRDFPMLPRTERPPNGKYNKLLLTVENKE